MNDANVFSVQYGLPNLTSTNFEKHTIGAVSVNPNATGEISLDVQWAHAIAPNAKILLVETSGLNDSLFDGVDYARNRTDVIAISMSWGSTGEWSGETSYDYHLQPSGNSSCCFFAASGDRCENVSYPACSPNVVAVGGTTLNFSGGSLANETVWYNGIVNGRPRGTGGGKSQYEIEPSYQASYDVSGASGHRCVPDVSFDADPNSGVSVYDSTPDFYNDTGWFTVGGTSMGAPCWAAIYSLGLTASNDHLYAIAKSLNYPSCFRDITNGTNGNYNATVGYDFCTGLGSPLTTTYGLLASTTACNVYYSDVSQNLTTFDSGAPNDYWANVNFTWNGPWTNNVKLIVQITNDGLPSIAWFGLNNCSYLNTGNHTASVDMSPLYPQAGNGTLQITLTWNDFECVAPRNETVTIVGSNNAPNIPSFVSYPANGYTGDTCVYTVNATDPDGDNIKYVFNWGDGTDNTTLTWRPSGTMVAVGHIWNSPGTYTVTVYVYDPYWAWSSKNVTTTIYEGGIGGCPYVYCWNGTNFVKDNNILPASETGNGTDTRDYYMLQQPLVPVLSINQTSLYSLQIREFESEQDYIDQVKLVAVDHAQGTSIAVTPEGKIVTYQNPASPLSCVDDYGNSRLNEIRSMDGNVSDPATYFQGNNGDWLLLNFGTTTATHANLILRDDYKCMDVCIDVRVPDGNGGWQTVEVLHPRDFWSIEAVNMTAYLPASGDFVVRLLWTAPHRLDYVGLDTSSPAQTTVNSTPPALAIHSTMGDVTSKLLYDDENCVELVNGQRITLAFTLPNKAQGMIRDFILYTDGYYYTMAP